MEGKTISHQVALPGPRALWPHLFQASPGSSTPVHTPPLANTPLPSSTASSPSSSSQTVPDAAQWPTTPRLRPADWGAEQILYHVDQSESPPQGENSGRRRRSYTCSVCAKSFARPSSLETHMNSHTGARPHVCPYPGCLRTFSVRSNMRRHHRSHYTLDELNDLHILATDHHP